MLQEAGFEVNVNNTIIVLGLLVGNPFTRTESNVDWMHALVSLPQPVSESSL